MWDISDHLAVIGVTSAIGVVRASVLGCRDSEVHMKLDNFLYVSRFVVLITRHVLSERPATCQCSATCTLPNQGMTAKHECCRWF
jgi:hypothetical protein